MQVADENFIDGEKKLKEEVLRREAIVSTAVNNGLAFPHARGIEGGGLTMALGIRGKGLKFSKDAKRLTRIIFFMVIPTAASAFYLKLLAGLTRAFRDKEAREKLLAAESEKEVWKLLGKLTRTSIS